MFIRNWDCQGEGSPYETESSSRDQQGGADVHRQPIPNRCGVMGTNFLSMDRFERSQAYGNDINRKQECRTNTPPFASS